MDARRLLDQFLGAGAGGALGNALGQGRSGLPGQSGGGLLGELQRGVEGMLGGQGGARGGGDLVDNLRRQAEANPMASGALAGGLAGILLGGKGRGGLSRDVVKLGGLGLVAGMAYRAYQDYQAKQAGQTPSNPSSTGQAQLGPSGQATIQAPPHDTPFMSAENEAEERARLLVTAM